MTERQVQGKWVLVCNNGGFEITEIELAGSNCIFIKDNWNPFCPFLHPGVKNGYRSPIRETNKRTVIFDELTSHAAMKTGTNTVSVCQSLVLNLFSVLFNFQCLFLHFKV